MIALSVTIKDIAKLAHVSHTTVSRALNNSELINPKTRARIQSIASDMNYTPNFSAKSLVLDRSYNLGLFFSTLQQGTSAVFFYETVRGVNLTVKDAYNLVVRGIDDYPDFSNIKRRSFDGIIVVSQSAADDAFIRYLQQIEMPLVVLNRYTELVPLKNILSDDRQGAFRIVEYLISCGHREIAIIEGKSGFKSSQERRVGYLDALTKYGLAANSQRVQGSYDLASGHLAMKQILAWERLPTAVFCANDEMAVGAMKAIVEQGLRVPEHISVVGYDDNAFSGFLTPALTTVKRPIEQISHLGAVHLLEIITKKQTCMEIIYLDTELIIRDSVRTIDNGGDYTCQY